MYTILERFKICKQFITGERRIFENECKKMEIWDKKLKKQKKLLQYFFWSQLKTIESIYLQPYT